MQYLKSIKNSLLGIFLLLFLWIFLLISAGISSHPKNDNLHFIPASSSFVLRANGNKLIRSTAFSLLFEARNEKTLLKLKELYSTSRKKEKTGIDINSAIAAFIVPSKYGRIYGLSFNLKNPEEFTAEHLKLDPENCFLGKQNKVGTLLFLFGKENKSGNGHQQLANFYKNEILTIDRPFEFGDQNNTRIAEIKSKGSVFGSQELFSKTDLFLDVKQNGFLLSGNLQLSNQKKSSVIIPSKTLMPVADAFHFTTALIPPSIQDSLKVISQRAGIPIPDIAYLSLNYSEMDIINDATGMHAAPVLDLLVNFKENIACATLFKDDEFLASLGATFLNNNLKIGEINYHVIQLDAKTIYFGVSKSPKLIENSNREIFVAKGDLKALLKIEGGGIITSFLEIIPAYKAAKDLLDNTNLFEISVRSNANGKAILLGQFQFKEDHFALDELLQFGITSKTFFENQSVISF